MKFVSVTFFLFIVLVYGLLSFGNGPASRNHDKTGSPLSDGKCMDCHSAGMFGVSLEIKMFEGETEVTKYTPGNKYKLKYIVKNIGNPSKYGIQTVVLNSDNKDAGDFDSFSSGFNAVNHKEATYIEHSSPQSLGFLNVDWIAPESGSGEITVYAGAIAANGNDGNSGDGGAIATLVLNENTSSNSDIVINSNDLFSLKTNLVNDYLAINLSNTNKASQGRIISQNGIVVKTFKIDSQLDYFELNVSNINPGIFFIQILQGEQQFTKKMAKY
jgi:hypothetical protein